MTTAEQRMRHWWKTSVFDNCPTFEEYVSVVTARVRKLHGEEALPAEPSLEQVYELAR